MIRILNAVLRRYGRIADRKIAQCHAGFGQLQYCTRCGTVREVDDDRCPECGAPWDPDDDQPPAGQPHIF